VAIKLSQVSIEACVDKIFLLEKTLGACVNYQIMEPFSVYTADLLDIQRAAKKISEFVGLKGLTFIVNTTQLRKGVSGNIELRSEDSAVFVELSTDTLKFSDAVLATLAHEITHKYLHRKGISCGLGPAFEYENEILTDIATIYIGLGKLYLNGCQCSNTETKIVNPNSTTTTTEKMRVGYLDQSRLAFVYRLICAMRNLPSAKIESGLKTDSFQMVRNCEKKHSEYIAEKFQSSQFLNELVSCRKQKVAEAQMVFSDINRNLMYIEGTLMSPTKEFLGKNDKRLRSIVQNLENVIKEPEYNPSLRYLKNMQSDKTDKELSSEIYATLSYAKEYLSFVNHVANMVKDSKKNKSKQNSLWKNFLKKT